MSDYNRDALIAALDDMHEQADVSGWLCAERVAEALGWKHRTEMPDGKWLRERLNKVLR